jgi:carbon monoxide dehydrogenase subunit G
MVTFSGSERISAEPERIWSFLMDSRRFTACAPAMRNVHIKNDREFTFEVEAPGRTIKMDARWEQLQQPSFARLSMQGGGRLTGGVRLDSEFRIAAQDSTSSSVDWSSNVELTGAAKMLVSEDRLREMVDGVNQDVIDCVRSEIEAS